MHKINTPQPSYQENLSFGGKLYLQLVFCFLIESLIITRIYSKLLKHIYIYSWNIFYGSSLAPECSFLRNFSNCIFQRQDEPWISYIWWLSSLTGQNQEVIVNISFFLKSILLATILLKTEQFVFHYVCVSTLLIVNWVL